MSKLTDQQAQALLKDRIWRLSHLYKIKTKDKKLQIIKPNKAQMEYLANETNRDIILKARQLGFSTLKLIEQLDFTISNRNVNTAIVAHKKEKVQVLFEIIRLAYENLPDLLRPRSSYDNRNELYFPELNSKIYVATDTRGETVHNLHVSELAYVERAEEKMLGILESVPRDGIISFESTANGMSGYFYNTWEDKDSEFVKHFYNWTLDLDYSEPTSKTIEQLMEEYRPLQVRYGLIPNISERLKLTKEQLNWYIAKVRRHRERVMQEYPSTPTEAFVASGRNVFNMADLQKHETKFPIDRKYQDLLIWEQPLQGFMYSIGCDPAEGVGEDNSVISVWNAYTGEQAAEMATNRVAPDDLAGFLLDIGTYYNKALLVIETNNHGITVMDRIKRKYANIYRREVYDKVSNEYTSRLGWVTGLLTKPRLVNDIEEAFRNEDMMIRSEDLLKECKTFVKTDEENKKGYGAEGTNHDDRVIAAGLALQGIKQLPKMKKPKTVAQQKLDEFIEKKRLQTLFPQNPVIHSHQQRRYKIRGI